VKICVLATTPPYPLDEGERLRVFNLLRHLPERHDLDLVALTETPAAPVPPALREIFNDVTTSPSRPSPHVSAWGRIPGRLRKAVAAVPAWIAAQHSPSLQALLDARGMERRYDLCLVCNVFMTQYRLPADTPVVVDLIDSPTLRLRRQLGQAATPGAKLIRLLSWLETRRYLRRVLPAAARVVVSSEVDARDLARLSPRSRVVSVPNGVDADYFRPGVPPLPGEVVVFSGVMGYPPNGAAALWFHRAVLPRVRAARPAVRFVLAGRGSDDDAFREIRSDPGAQCTGRVDDLRPYVGGATVYVSPLTMGTGIKNKILEALALERAVVATSVSCEGIDVVPGVHLLRADGRDGFARAVLALLGARDERERLGANGRRLVQERYRWAAQSQRLNEVFHAAREEQGARPARTSLDHPAREGP
jgi:glycosyltransferase involved in cell wall biosynthesis